ncbi:hypothetical protein Cni_G17909 [Canna indica]|uniref:Uncharacterized protein n=1 Tax=Canna indica TaxID=4628 RepID=A0AAQ3QDX9_9LILI|nr:hypothetical protein Cni_G17909 [Canna indica]
MENNAGGVLSSLALGVLTCNCAAAIYRSVDDRWAVAFVATSYVLLLLLFLCVNLFHRNVGVNNRRRLKTAIWFLATLVTLMFSWKVASVMPFYVAVLVWFMGAATSLGGFCAFFVYGYHHRTAAAPEEDMQ